MSVGVFFELLWLDLFPAGTFIPPHGVFALSAALTLLAGLPDADMRLTSVVLLAVLPLAYLGSSIEQSYRKRQNLSYNTLITWNRRRARHAYLPDALVYKAAIEIFLLNFLLFLICVTALLPVVRLIRPWLGAAPQPTWPMLWICASVGAILSLRIRKAYAWAAAGLVLGVLGTL